MKAICLKSQKKEFKINVDLGPETDGSVQRKRFGSDCYCLVAHLRGFQVRNVYIMYEIQAILHRNLSDQSKD